MVVIICNVLYDLIIIMSIIIIQWLAGRYSVPNMHWWRPQHLIWAFLDVWNLKLSDCDECPEVVRVGVRWLGGYAVVLYEVWTGSRVV